MRAVHPIPAPENVTLPVPVKEVPKAAEQLPKPVRTARKAKTSKKAKKTRKAKTARKAKTERKDAYLEAPVQARGTQRRNVRQMPTRRMNNRSGR
jgi:hypothetical protein